MLERTCVNVCAKCVCFLRHRKNRALTADSHWWHWSEADQNPEPLFRSGLRSKGRYHRVGEWPLWSMT